MSTHKWTLADYKLQDQCMLLPGCGALRPYRLKFFCAGEVANHVCQEKSGHEEEGERSVPRYGILICSATVVLRGQNLCMHSIRNRPLD
jgi:hypothetical protein